MNRLHIFSSESVGEGHPDKVADLISDTVVDACLAQDPASRVACETLVKDSHVILAGEITTQAVIDYEKLVRDTVRAIGYATPADDPVFNADTLRDAQAHPDKYQDLQIRVCGWNVLWNDICKEEQDAFILQAEALV